MSNRIDTCFAALKEKNEKARICISAVTLETLSKAVSLLEEMGYETDIAQIAVSQSRSIGGSTAGSGEDGRTCRTSAMHMMTAQNPIWLITGERV